MLRQRENLGCHWLGQCHTTRNLTIETEHWFPLTVIQAKTHIIVFMCSTWSDISFTTALIFSTDPSEDFQISSI